MVKTRIDLDMVNHSQKAGGCEGLARSQHLNTSTEIHHHPRAGALHCGAWDRGLIHRARGEEGIGDDQGRPYMHPGRAWMTKRSEDSRGESEGEHVEQSVRQSSGQMSRMALKHGPAQMDMTATLQLGRQPRHRRPLLHGRLALLRHRLRHSSADHHAWISRAGSSSPTASSLRSTIRP